MNHESYEELLALDALEAGDARQQSALREHLVDCADCRAELKELREVAAVLAYAVTPVTPPARLRQLILKGISATPVLAPATRAEARAGVNVGAGSAAATARDSSALPPRPAPPRWPARNSWRLLAVAASLVAVVAASSSLILWRRAKDASAELAQMSDRLVAAQADAGRERGYRDMFVSGATRVTTLRGTKSSPRARAVVIFDGATNRALLVAGGLPKPPAGKAYQLWFFVAGRPLPGGTFAPDEGGAAELLDHAPDAARDAAAFAVTLEPAGGVSAPTGDLYLETSTS